MTRAVQKIAGAVLRLVWLESRAHIRPIRFPGSKGLAGMQYRSSGRFEHSKHDPVVVMPSPFMNRRLFIRPERTSVAIELAESVGDPVAPLKASSRLVCPSSEPLGSRRNSNRTKNRTTLQTMIIYKCVELLPMIVDPPRIARGGRRGGEGLLRR